MQYQTPEGHTRTHHKKGKKETLPGSKIKPIYGIPAYYFGGMGCRAGSIGGGIATGGMGSSNSGGGSSGSSTAGAGGGGSVGPSMP